MQASSPFYRFRCLLRATKSTRIATQQGVLMYALVCEANRSGTGAAAFPESLLLDVPELGRTSVAEGSLFAWGGTILANTPQSATEQLERWIQGLNREGAQPRSRGRGWRGNFKIERVEDLVAQREWRAGDQLQRLDATQVDRELMRLIDQPEFTIRLLSPLRIERPKSQRSSGRGFLDDLYFDPEVFVNRVLARLKRIGIVQRDQPGETPVARVPTELLQSKLIWLDVAYGGKEGKTLGGVVGEFRIRCTDWVARAALVWGQYARVGKNTSFGFGDYRIEELGPNPYACQRASSLLELAWKAPQRDAIAHRSGLEPGELQHSIDRIRSGEYQPDPCQRLVIGPEEKRRELRIPSRRDRALQRLVLETIGAGLDQLFESSSFAWRRGLGRHTAARAIGKAWTAGFRFAVKADFDRFFDSIDRTLLEQRLRAYLADDSLVDLLMMWMYGAADSGTGIPTGAPVSPLLGNLMLDRFDEQIAALGGRLVRYGDDFLILCQRQEQAEACFAEASQLAETLSLRLNADSQPSLDLNEPFEFLGFRFEKRDVWRASGQGAKPLEELGWRDAQAPKENSTNWTTLPGESRRAAREFGFAAVIGPIPGRLGFEGEDLSFTEDGSLRKTRLPLHELETLVTLGPVRLAEGVLHRLGYHGVKLILCDERGYSQGAFTADHDEDPQVVIAQVGAAGDATRTMAIAKRLVEAKLGNYQRLAAAHGTLAEVAERLSELQLRAGAAESVEKLRGIEGAGAAIWYQNLGRVLRGGFRMEQRVAPNAADPINVLLNIGYSHLFRLSALALRSAGLVPSIGFLHVASNRYAALAADLQEPFRFLVDRVVIDATSSFKPRMFQRTEQGPYALTIEPGAAREFQRRLWTGMSMGTTWGDEEPVSYLVRLERQARSLRRHLLDESREFETMRLP